MTPKQQQFVKEYLVDLNATQAAIRAGYSARTATWIGPQLLGKSHVQAAVQAAIAERGRRVGVTADQVVKELVRIAFVDTSRLVKFEGGRMVLTETANLTEDERRAVSEMSESVTENSRTRKFKMHDKLKALELLGRHLGMWKEKLEVSGEVTLGALLAQSKRGGGNGNT